MNSDSPCRLLRHFLVLAFVALATAAATANVYQANLMTLGEGARLQLGQIYFRTDADRVEFVAVVSPFGPLTSELNAVLTGPGSSIHFSLGEGERSALYGLYTIADHNPFLPREPRLPAGFDEDGLPYYVDAPVIRMVDIYTGEFVLPPGFESILLAGQGEFQLNEFIGGSIRLVAVPEPSAAALFLIGAGALFCGVGRLR